MSEALKRMAAEYRANAGLLLKRINELNQSLHELIVKRPTGRGCEAG